MAERPSSSAGTSSTGTLPVRSWDDAAQPLQAKHRQLHQLRQSLRGEQHVLPSDDAPKGGAETMTKAVQVALLRVLWQAVHSRRSLFGLTCYDLPSFFAALDQSCTGAIDRTELREAFTRLDVGLTATQLDRLIATLDTDHNGKIDFSELEQWMSAGGAAVAPPSPVQEDAAAPWTPVAAVSGAPVSAERADHLPSAQISTDSSGWKEVLGGTAVARGRARGNAALGRASRNGQVAMDGHGSPWRQRSADSGSGAGTASTEAGTPPRHHHPRSPSVASSPDSLFAAVTGMRDAGLSPPFNGREAWAEADRPHANGAEAQQPGSRPWNTRAEDDEDDELSENDLEEAARMYEATEGRAAMTGSADPPMSARDGWELCCDADGAEYWFNFQTGERRENKSEEAERASTRSQEEELQQEKAEEPRRCVSSTPPAAAAAAAALSQPCFESTRVPLQSHLLVASGCRP